jgi:hypothetical protein
VLFGRLSVLMALSPLIALSAVMDPSVANAAGMHE